MGCAGTELDAPKQMTAATPAAKQAGRLFLKSFLGTNMAHSLAKKRRELLSKPKHVS